MPSILPIRIKEKLEDQGLTMAALERKAQIPMGTVQKILAGTIKNPTLETIWAIARALQCRIDSLVDENEEEEEPVIDTKKTFISDLYLECDKFVNQYLKSHSIEFSVGEALSLIKDIYNYSVDRADSTVDKRFAAWLLARHCSKNYKR